MNVFRKHWGRLKRSWGRRWRESRLPRGYMRLGTRYGGWWIDSKRIGKAPILIDCGLGEDISFPTAFLQRYPDAKVIGVEPNPRSLAYAKAHCPENMEIIPQAIWTHAGETLTFHLPRSQDLLPKGADGVSGSLIDSHEYVEGGDRLEVVTTDFATILRQAGRTRCDVLKLDIEGAEYALLQKLAADGHLAQVDQLLLEFHHGVTEHADADTEAALKLIVANGFERIYTEGRNFIFRRFNES